VIGHGLRRAGFGTSEEAKNPSGTIVFALGIGLDEMPYAAMRAAATVAEANDNAEKDDRNAAVVAPLRALADALDGMAR
jgi:hypothetical protein